MELTFFPLTLEAVDQARADALCLFVGEDERPLAGLAGLADWRLAGGLSRLLRRGLVTGSLGEALLTPAQRLGFRRLFLFGVGPAGQREEVLAARVSDGLRRLQAAGVEDAALELPRGLGVEAGIRALVEEAQAPARGLVFGADPGSWAKALLASPAGAPADSRLERRVVKVTVPSRPASSGRLTPPSGPVLPSPPQPPAPGGAPPSRPRLPLDYKAPRLKPPEPKPGDPKVSDPGPGKGKK